MKQPRFSHSDFSGPLRQSHCFAVEGEHVIVSLVMSLVKIRCPSAILGRIIPLIVDALDAATWGGFSAHIREEILKRMNPAITNSYPSAAIIGILFVIGIVTTLLHRPPGMIFRRGAHAMRTAQPACFLFTDTTTIRRSSISQGCAAHDFDSTTIATAFPKVFRKAGPPNKFKDGPFSKALANIRSIHMKYYNIIIRFTPVTCTAAAS